MMLLSFVFRSVITGTAMAGSQLVREQTQQSLPSFLAVPLLTTDLVCQLYVRNGGDPRENA